jgi:hypothetical protein
MTRLKLPFAAIATVLVLLFVVGCNKSQPTSSVFGKLQPVPETKDESGWPVYQVTAQGFSLSLPPDWRHIEMDPATWEAKSKEILQQNPQLEQMLAGFKQQMTAGIKFYGFDEGTIGTRFGTNINVGLLAVPAGATLDTIVAQTMVQYESAPGVLKPVEQKRLKTKAGDCARIQFKMTMNTPNKGQMTMALTQFVFFQNDKCFVVTGTTRLESEAKYAATFEKIGQSFRFTN